VALLIAGLAVAACSSSAVPLASSAPVLPTASPLATAAPTPSAPPSPAPSATVAVVKIPPIVGAPDSKLVLHLIAEGGKWDMYSLTAPAGKVWHITVVSQEPIGHHNFVVASGKTFEERIYTGKNLLPKATVTYDVPALPAGSYLFICTVHPETMTGTLTLQ
jgi:plastocyanin